MPEGLEKKAHNWNEDFAKSLAVFLYGGNAAFYVIFNAHYEPVMYRLPEEKFSAKWQTILNTADREDKETDLYNSRDEMVVEGRTILVLKAANPL